MERAGQQRISDLRQQRRGADDMLKVFQGKVQYPVDNAPVWKYTGKNGLKAPEVKAVAEFRKAVEESEKAAAQKQQQPGQKKNL